MTDHTTHSTLSNRSITVAIAILLFSIVSLAALPPVITTYVANPLLVLAILSVLLYFPPPPSYAKYHY